MSEYKKEDYLKDLHMQDVIFYKRDLWRYNEVLKGVLHSPNNKDYKDSALNLIKESALNLIKENEKKIENLECRMIYLRTISNHTFPITCEFDNKGAETRIKEKQ